MLVVSSAFLSGKYYMSDFVSMLKHRNKGLMKGHLSRFIEAEGQEFCRLQSEKGNPLDEHSPWLHLIDWHRLIIDGVNTAFSTCVLIYHRFGVEVFSCLPCMFHFHTGPLAESAPNSVG